MTYTNMMDNALNPHIQLQNIWVCKTWCSCLIWKSCGLCIDASHQFLSRFINSLLVGIQLTIWNCHLLQNKPAPGMTAGHLSICCLISCHGTSNLKHRKGQYFKEMMKSFNISSWMFLREASNPSFSKWVPWNPSTA